MVVTSTDEESVFMNGRFKCSFMYHRTLGKYEEKKNIFAYQEIVIFSITKLIRRRNVIYLLFHCNKSSASTSAVCTSLITSNAAVCTWDLLSIDFRHRHELFGKLSNNSRLFERKKFFFFVC